MQMRRPPQQEEPERVMRMRWDGTEQRAGEIVNWARDAALLPYAAATAPDRNAAEDTPEARWRLQIKTEVPASHGGGTQWESVPEGATIYVTGPVEDPVFEFRTPRMAAKTLTEGESK